ncbi:MAG: hypothetical protein FJ087_23575, partial [Deltaproteobacteria bacterium]|nr:hypothetical protein [Deltaproteobacteria bacterium]
RAGLLDMVAAAGVAFCGASFPFMDPGSVPAWPRASAWVVTPWAVADKGLLPAVSRLGVAVRRVAAPFGIEGTLAWLDGVRAAVGLPPADPEARASLAGPWPERLAALHGETGARRVGLVVPADEAGEALSPRVFFGLDPVALLRELGLRPIVVLARPRAAAAPVPPPDAPDLVLQGCDEPIVETLRRAACDLVYSDHAGDSRVTRAGATPFDVRLLVPGIPGAVATARRLLALCRVPFHARYARLLGGDAP